MALNSMVTNAKRTSRPTTPPLALANPAPGRSVTMSASSAASGPPPPPQPASSRRRRHDTQLDGAAPSHDRDNEGVFPAQGGVMNDNALPQYWFFSVTNWFEDLNKPYAATVLILCFVNLINYMDRSTVAGVLVLIEQEPSFDIKGDKALGLLQTSFVFCYMIFAPIFGYLGDRHDRRLILGLGMTLWLMASFLGSFMSNFWAFLFFRALVGIGEASYSTIAPAIISDLFAKDRRSQVLSLFYFAIPVGTGLGYIVGSQVAVSAGDWRWSLRVPPLLGFLALLGVVFFMIDPARGNSEGAHLTPSSPKEDMLALVRNKSFMLSTVAFTCVTFSVGALMLWGPKFAYFGARAACGSKANCEKILQSTIAYRFGIVMTLAGLLGVPGGSFLSQRLRHKIPNADPLVSATTLLISVPVLYFGFISARYDVNWCYFLTFIAGLLLNCNWAIVSDMTLYIVLPTRRSFASATQILFSHALGDAISPFLIGVVADWIRPIIAPKEHEGIGSPSNLSTSFASTDEAGLGDLTPEQYDVEFRSLQYALFSSCFFQAFGALFFYVVSFYVLTDKRVADEAIHGLRSGDDDDEGFSDTAPIVQNMHADEAGGRVEEVDHASGRRNRVT